MSILNPIFKLFGQLLMWLYSITNSYVLAIVIFTLLIKLVLFPLYIKSKKSMMRTQALQGKMQQLQKQYGKDRERYNQEVQKLYEREGVNPMGGCLWTMLPLPILWGVYAVVRRPLFFMYNLTADQVTAVQEAVEKIHGAFSGRNAYVEMNVASLLSSDSSALEAARAALGSDAGRLDRVIDFHFIGLDLSQTPTLKFWENGLSWQSIGLFLIPILVVIVSFISTWVSQKTNAMTQSDEKKPMDPTTRSMLIMMPLMYLWFGFIMPAAMCVYMMLSVLFQMAQDKIASRLLRAKFAEMKAQQEERDRLEREQEKAERAAKIEAKKKAEEEAKKNRKKGISAPKKDKAPTTDKGTVGIRRYALGRNYEPDRFGGVTPYRDPSGAPAAEPVDEDPADQIEDLTETAEENLAEEQVKAQIEEQTESNDSDEA